MSINYPLLNKNISKKKSVKFKEKKNYPRTISSDFHSKKRINLEDLFGGIFFKNNNKNQKKFSGKEAIKEALNIGNRIKTESAAKNLDTSYIKYADELVQNTQISARNNSMKLNPEIKNIKRSNTDDKKKHHNPKFFKNNQEFKSIRKILKQSIILRSEDFPLNIKTNNNRASKKRKRSTR